MTRPRATVRTASDGWRSKRRHRRQGRRTQTMTLVTHTDTCTPGGVNLAPEHARNRTFSSVQRRRPCCPWEGPRNRSCTRVAIRDGGPEAICSDRQRGGSPELPTACTGPERAPSSPVLHVLTPVAGPHRRLPSQGPRPPLTHARRAPRTGPLVGCRRASWKRGCGGGSRRGCQ